MLSVEEARVRVARGAAHLDEVRPGWWNEIDVGTLTLRDPCCCIVGQLVGGSSFSRFSADVARLFPELPTVSIATATFYGVDIGSGLWRFSDLQDTWIEAIAARVLAHDAEGRDLRRDVSEPTVTAVAEIA